LEASLEKRMAQKKTETVITEIYYLALRENNFSLKAKYFCRTNSVDAPNAFGASTEQIACIRLLRYKR